MKGKKYIILVILVILFVGNFFIPRSLDSSKEVFFRVERGEGSRDIAINLEKEGLIFWGPIFRVYVHIKGISGQLKAGDYLLSPSMSIASIAEKLAQGDIVEEKITIIEGWTLKDIGFYLENKGMFQAEELCNEYAKVEGYFFPDTYKIEKNMPLGEIIEMAIDNFDKKTKGMGVTKDVLIMASILEKEVITKEEKQLAAGVLWKRLGIGMALQVDCAPITYERPGFPVNPICNPGLESIEAALSPKDSDYWYYLSKPDGITVFSKTLEEHNINKAKYLK